MFQAHRAHHQERQIVSIQPLLAVGGCVVCRSERVKNENKYIEKKCASHWSFTKNYYMMHGQQHIIEFSY